MGEIVELNEANFDTEVLSCGYSCPGGLLGALVRSLPDHGPRAGGSGA